MQGNQEVGKVSEEGLKRGKGIHTKSSPDRTFSQFSICNCGVQSEGMGLLIFVDEERVVESIVYDLTITIILLVRSLVATR